MQRISSYLTLGLLFITTIVVALDAGDIEKSGIRADNIEFDVASGEWIFSGNVIVKQENLELRADTITLYFKESDLIEAIAIGKPASFEQQPDGSDHVIKGYSKKIVIDNSKRVATFSGDAVLRQHLHEIKGAVIIYDMETERMSIRGIPENDLPTQSKAGGDTKLSSGVSTRPTLIIQTTNSAGNTQLVQPQVQSSGQTPIPIIDNKPSNQKLDENQENKTPSLQKFTAARVIDAGAAAYNNAGRNSVLVGGLSGKLPVKILEIQNDWARAHIRSGISVWVYSQYVEKVNDTQGRITGHGVRARSMPSTNSSIISILEPDQQITILSRNSDWTRITLPESTDLWIPSTQLQILETVTEKWKTDWAHGHNESTSSNN